MRIGDAYLLHPKTALAAQTICAAALGYISSTIQRLWHPEDFLLLHISVWWVALLLVILGMGERPRRRRSEEHSSPGELPPGCRRNVLFRTSSQWEDESLLEQFDADLPPGELLFRRICFGLPFPPWSVDSLTLSLRREALHCSIRRTRPDEAVTFDLEFISCDGEWLLTVSILSAATESDVRRFLLDLHRSIASTPGVSDVRWYRDEALEDRLIEEVDPDLAAESPLEDDQ